MEAQGIRCYNETHKSIAADLITPIPSMEKKINFKPKMGPLPP